MQCMFEPPTMTLKLGDEGNDQLGGGLGNLILEGWEIQLDLCIEGVNSCCQAKHYVSVKHADDDNDN